MRNNPLRKDEAKATLWLPVKKRSAPKWLPAQPPLAQDVGYLAERVIAGDRVYTDLNDDSFVMLMAELRRRGYVLAPRGADDPDRELNSFLFRVAQTGFPPSRE